MVHATIDALKKQKASPRMVAARRGKKFLTSSLAVQDDQVEALIRTRRKKMAAKKKATVTIEQTGSPIGRPADQRATLVGLGLK